MFSHKSNAHVVFSGNTIFRRHRIKKQQQVTERSNTHQQDFNEISEKKCFIVLNQHC